jgi:hypothetical protein
MFTVLMTACLVGVLSHPHERVAHKAGKDVQVLIEVRVLSVPLSRVGVVTGCLEEMLKTGQQPKPCATVFLVDRQVVQLLKTVRTLSEARTVQAPRLGVLNGQRAVCEVTTQVDYVIDHDVVQEKGDTWVHPQALTVHPGWKFTCLPRVLEDPASVLLDFEASETTLAPVEVGIYRTVEVHGAGPSEAGREATRPLLCYAQLPSCTTHALHGMFNLPAGQTAVVHFGPTQQALCGARPYWARVPLLNLLWAGDVAWEANYELILLTVRLPDQER